VIVVDDGSSDATAEQARAAGATVIRHPFNLGQGAALQAGSTMR
jgi:glycosyltransferase involved in cell wall biosynthesis